MNDELSGEKEKAVTAEEFDRRFDAGEDVSDHLDYSRASRPNPHKGSNPTDFLKEEGIE